MSTQLSRKEFLSAAAKSAVCLCTPLDVGRLLPSMAFFAPPGQEPRGDILIAVFQRGGMDGLNAVIPQGEIEYYRQRPTLAVAESNGGKASAIDLDGFFGLHPSLGAFKNIWDAGELAIVHASGSPDPTHSHFDAMDYMERGTPGEKSLSSGWLARHLQTTDWDNDSPFRAVGIGAMLQSSLRGPVSATAMQSIAQFHLGGDNQSAELAQFQATLGELYGTGSLLDATGQLTLGATSTLEQVIQSNYQPSHGAGYPDSAFGQGLLQIAQLIKAEVGLEVATIDIGGWDTHAQQGALEGDMPNLLQDLADSLAAFYTDLGSYTQRVTIVTMSEFGRRLQENGAGGTDHGHGNVMFLMGGGLNGGKVYGDWPGLAADALYGPGDLAITTDYRDVLAEIVQKRLANEHVAEVFPGYSDMNVLGLARG